jgi:multidrug efflux pump subunit AcrA (membrane-fusion protein)
MIRTTILLCALLCLIAGCTKNDAELQSSANVRAAVSNEGNHISFPQGAPGLATIESKEIHKGEALVSVIAPARVVASIGPSVPGDGRMVLFESPDVTTLYSQYQQSKANQERTSKNLARVKDMYANQTATAKDLTEAENDAATARTVMNEFEGKLRAYGFQPSELENARQNSVWLISDVTEAQLKDVDKGESVDVFFTAFPDKKFEGKAEAIGEVVDPVTRTVKVRVSLSNPANRFLPGMFARIDFGDPVSGVYVLPLSSVVTVEGKDYVFVQTSPGVFERRSLTVRSSTMKEVIAVSGIADGDRVVTAGAMLLKGLSFGY